MRQLKHIPHTENPRLFPAPPDRSGRPTLAGRFHQRAWGRGFQIARAAYAWDGWRDGRRWIVLGALVGAAGLLTVGLGARHIASDADRQRAAAGQITRQLQAPQVSPDGTRIVLGESFLHNIRVAPAALTGFRVVKEAIGQIAFNEDRSTPVYSPYSGRVVRLLAKAGDRVARGSALFEIARSM